MTGTPFSWSGCHVFVNSLLDVKGKPEIFKMLQRDVGKIFLLPDMWQG